MGGEEGGEVLLEISLRRVGEVVGDEMGIHIGCPGIGVVSASVGTVGDATLFEFLHDDVMEFKCHFSFWFFSGDFVGKFDEPVKILCLALVHPVSAVDKRSFDHLELFSRYHRQAGLEVLNDIEF